MMPVPRDILLPLPLDRMWLELLIVVLFLAHILFVNLMLGGSVLTLVYEILGLRQRRYDNLAREIAKTITVNKSLAVVLGVAPLLVINLLYTTQFYSANALTGTAWISIVPLVSVAFLLVYLHKYSWDRLAESKGLHIMLGAMATGLLLFIPLIFLANINLMLFPERWSEVHGFLSALWLPNVLPRYLHFVVASLAITGLLGVGWFGRREYPVAERLPEFDHAALRRQFYGVVFAATLLQLVVGPLVYFTLPVKGMTVLLTLVILVGLTLALVMLHLLWREIVAPAARIGRYFAVIVILLSAIVPCMAFARHLYREQAVVVQDQLMAQRTADYENLAVAAARRAEAGIQLVKDKTPLGEQVFATCKACHALDKTLVGPSLVEISQIYPDNPAGIVAWAKAPGRKRAGVVPMPSFAHLGDKRLKAVAEYMLDAVKPKDESQNQPQDEPPVEQQP